jgi:hypothetical protein
MAAHGAKEAPFVTDCDGPLLFIKRAEDTSELSLVKLQLVRLAGASFNGKLSGQRNPLPYS